MTTNDDDKQKIAELVEQSNAAIEELIELYEEEPEEEEE